MAISESGLLASRLAAVNDIERLFQNHTARSELTVKWYRERGKKMSQEIF